MPNQDTNMYTIKNKRWKSSSLCILRAHNNPIERSTVSYNCLYWALHNIMMWKVQYEYQIMGYSVGIIGDRAQKETI